MAEIENWTVQRVTGDCIIDGTSYGIVGVTARIGINNWPSATVQILTKEVQEGGCEVLRIDEDTLFSVLEGWQQKMLAGELTAEVSWLVAGGGIDDVTQGSIKGYVASISQIIRYGDIATELVIVPEYTKVDAINLVLYRQVLTSGNLNGSFDKNRPKLNKQGLAKYIIEIVDWMFKAWDDNGELFMKSLSSLEKELYKSQHQINRDNIQTFKDLITNSEEFIGKEYTPEAMTRVLGADATEALCRTIVSCLCQGLGSFLSTIVALANVFRLIYVPNLYEIGCLKNKDAMLYEAPTDVLESPTISLNFSIGGTGYLPVTRVISVIDNNSPNLNRAVHSKVSDAAYAEVEGALTGRTILISPPIWIPRNMYIVPVNSDGSQPERLAIRPSLQAEWSDALDQQAQANTSIEYFSGLLHNWCRQELSLLIMSGTAATLTTFLDTFEVGVRKQASFGTGFIALCSIDITVGADGNGKAQSTYVYTHVLYGLNQAPKIN